MSAINEAIKEVDENKIAVRALCESIAEQCGHAITEADAVSYLNEMTFGEAMSGDELMENFNNHYNEWTTAAK